MQLLRARPWILAALLGALTSSAAAQTDDPKSAFVTALGRFSTALDGAYGDERRTILGSLDDMERELRLWDGQIAVYEAAMAADLPRADAELAARMHLALGGVYLDRGRVDDAIREFTDAVRLNPANAEAQSLLGVAYRDGTHDRTAAIQAFTRAAAGDVDNPASLYLLVRELTAAKREEADAEARRLAAWRPGPPDGSPRSPFLRVALVPEVSRIEPFFPPAIYADGYARLLRSDLPGAVAQWREAAARDPVAQGAGAARGFVERSGAALRDGRTSDAVEQLDAAIQLEPGLAEPRRLHGLALAADGNIDAGLKDLIEAVRLAPADERSRLSLAGTLIDAGRLTDAADTLQAAIRALPQSGRAHYLLAQVRQRQGRYPEAIAGLHDATRFNPMLGVNSIYDTIGALEASRQEFDAAIEAYRARTELVPNDPDGHQRLGDIYARAGRDEDALPEFVVTLILRPASPDAYSAIAQLRLRAGAYPEAADAARQALALDQARIDAHYALGTALLRMGRSAEGRAELATYQRMQASAATARARQMESDSLQREAALSAANGDAARAVALLRRAAEIEEDSAAVRLDLGMALARAGQPGEALAELTRAAALGAPPEVHRYLSEAYAATGRSADSRRERALYQQLKQESLRQGAVGR